MTAAASASSTNKPSTGNEACPLPPKDARGPRLLYDWAKRIWCGMARSRSLGLAAEMAFWLFLSLLPLAAVGGLIVARVAASDGALAGAMLSSVPSAIRELISTELGKVAKWNGGEVAPLAGIVFAWLAASGIHSVFNALELQRGAERPWWKTRLIALATCVALSAGVAVLALLGTGLGWVYRLADAHVPAALANAGGSYILGVARIVFGALIALGLVAGIYVAGTPRVNGQRAAVWPGAVLAVLLEALSGFGYGLYIHIVGTGSAYEAGLGIVGVTMMFLYLFCLALLIGAELNGAVTDRREEKKKAAAARR